MGSDRLASMSKCFRPFPSLAREKEKNQSVMLAILILAVNNDTFGGRFFPRS